jgi:hypothetical protein
MAGRRTESLSWPEGIERIKSEMYKIKGLEKEGRPVCIKP